MSQLEIRVRGLVQGVGMRPTVWRFARELGLAGEVVNDGDGVLIRAGGPREALSRLIERIRREAPPLARVEQIEACVYEGELPLEFRIGASKGGRGRTQIAPDAAVCAACAAEVLDPAERRHGYPFATCTHCGPRLTIVTGVPYDRAATTMAGFALCAACRAQYEAPEDRRFHAETIACPACGPRARLVWIGAGAGAGSAGSAGDPEPVGGDAIAAACRLLADGEIVAVKGLGGYHLACDATRADVVQRLRERKHRDAKPFALVARDLDMIRRYCRLGPAEVAALTGPEAPIVLLAADGPERLPAALAPGLATLGFMLPTTPLHLLIARALDRPLVLTSGNLADEPQVARDGEVAPRLGGIAGYALVHDRAIAHRVDDSVVRVMAGAPRVLRRARGFAPAPIPLPLGFERAPEVLALGGDLKATFCLTARGEVVVSQHQGDLWSEAVLDDYRASLALYAQLLSHAPALVAADAHPDLHAGRLARELGAARARSGADPLPLVRVQHHHAHVAACLVDNAHPLDGSRVLGVVLDGIGAGDDGALWGGEVLLADYLRAERVAGLRPVALLGGDRAAIEPWRNAYAHLAAALGWPALEARYGGLPLVRRLLAKPRAVLDAMLARNLHAPLASSCGRLFDAVAAAVGIAFERQAYEGEAAMRLEAAAAAEPRALEAGDDPAYGFSLEVPAGRGPSLLDPRPLWEAILRDLALGVPAGVIAARFHCGLARAITEVAVALHRRYPFEAVALSGGCFQNRVLVEQCAGRLRAQGLRVLLHARIPASDGGLSVGQAAIAAARALRGGVP